MVKNGINHNGKQNHKCKACGRQFVEAPRQKIISEESKTLIDKLLLEKIPLAGMARVCDVSETWLQDWDSLPCTDSVRSLTQVFGELTLLLFPTQRLKAGGKESGKTNYIERFNCTMRQRVSRLVRKTLSFSKKLDAIWFFIHHYNSSLPV